MEGNKISHTLHKVIGDIVQTGEFPKCTIIKDPACGGNQNIPLFCSTQRSNQTEYCNVDLLIIKDNKIRVIIEIEEADIKPTQICGKFLASALSSYFIHKTQNDVQIGMGDSVSFIQILGTSKLKVDKTSKINQGKHIEKSIMNTLPIKGSKIRKYKLLYGNASEFRIRNGKKRAELFSFIKQELK
jgi:hypothetical protein